MAQVATVPKTHSRRFPNESKEYRKARERLLEAERELRDQVEEVAALRRKLPLGGELKEDYVFKEAAGDKTAHGVRLSELFESGKDSLLIYLCGGKPGQDGRHVDIVWPLWNLLDLTPEGRGANWYPKLRYD